MLYTPRFLVVNLINLIAYSAINAFVLLPIYLTGHAQWEIGLVMGSFQAAAVAARPLLGHPMDALGRRPFIIGGLVGVALCSLAYEQVGTCVPLIALVRFGQGASFAVYFTAIYTWVADHAPPGRMAEALGAFGISGLLTMAMGSALGERVVARAGFSGMFLAAAAACGVAAVVALSIREAGYVRHEGSGSALGLFLAMSRRAVLLAPLAAILAFGAGVGAVSAFAAPWLAALRAGRGSFVPDVAAFFATYSGTAVGVRLLVGRLADRVGRQNVIIPAMGVLGVGIGTLGLMAGHDGSLLGPVLAAGILIGMGHGAVYPALNAMVMDRVSVVERGKAMSLFTAASDSGTVLGAVAFGVVASGIGYALAFAAAGVGMGLGCLVFVALERRWRAGGGG